LVFDFGLMSLLLVGAHLLRARIRLLRDYCVPSAMLAGGVALAAGPNGCDWLPFRSPRELASYPSMLVVLLFATLFLGFRPRTVPLGRELQRVGDTFFYSVATELGQYGLALLFGVFVLAPLNPGLNPAFALMLPAGFAGGPGTATATAEGLRPYGWNEALTIGLTFATAGLLSGVLGGMLLINVAARRGWTRLVRSPRELPHGLQSGFLPAEEQSSLGRETVSPLALDPLAWHVALAMAAVMLGYLAQGRLKALWPAYEVPAFVLAMLSGALAQVVLNWLGHGRAVDRHVMSRIGSTAADYLIAFGIAGIEPLVVRAYAVPLAVLVVFGVVYSMAVLWFVGRRAYHNFWFERGLFTYGWNTGVIGTGVALLRVIDPRMQSGTLEDYGLAYLLIAGIDISLIVFLPPLVGAGHVLVPAVVLVAAAVGFMVLSARFIGWFTPSATAPRQGELEKIASSTSEDASHASGSES
jgi:ESS family glutamate:Na+ symporter